jgi:hypothetical protein
VQGRVVVGKARQITREEDKAEATGRCVAPSVS